MALVLGTVNLIIGQASAVSVDGTIRQLKVGDPVYENDIVTTADFSGLSIKLSNGEMLDLGRGSEIVVNEETLLLNVSPSVEQETSDVDNESPDLVSYDSISLEPSQSIYSENIVIVERKVTSPEVTLNSSPEIVTLEDDEGVEAGRAYFEGVNSRSDLILPIFELPADTALPQTPTQPPIDPPVTPEEPEIPENFLVDITEGIFPTMNEMSFAEGALPDLPSLTQSGYFIISAPDGLSELSIDGIAAYQDGTLVETSLLLSSGNNLTLTSVTPEADGKYRFHFDFTLNSLIDHTEVVNGVTGKTFFEVSATDTDGDTKTTDLSISVEDAVPVISVIEGSAEKVYDLTVTNFGDAQGFPSSYGIYIKGENGEPISGTILFADISDPANLETSVTLENIDPENIGFFLVDQGGSRNPDITNMTEVTFELGGDGYYRSFYNGVMLEAFNNELAQTLFSDPALNYDNFQNMLYTDSPGQQIWERQPGGRIYTYTNGNFEVSLTEKNGLVLNEANFTAPDSIGRPITQIGVITVEGFAGFGLELVINNVNGTGLADDATGNDILLRYAESNPGTSLVEGYFSHEGEDLVAFELLIESGSLTVTHIRPLTTDGSYGQDYINLAPLKTGAVSIQASITDTDGSTGSTNIDLGDWITFTNEATPEGNTIGPLIIEIGNPLAQVIEATTENNYIYGQGGIDTFKWSEGSDGTPENPGFDSIFDYAPGEVLDFSDLLQGEESGDITDFISIVNNDDIFFELSPNGDGNVTQVINILRKDAADFGIDGFDLSTQQTEALNQLISNGTIVVDQS